MAMVPARAAACVAVSSPTGGHRAEQRRSGEERKRNEQRDSASAVITPPREGDGQQRGDANDRHQVEHFGVSECIVVLYEGQNVGDRGARPALCQRDEREQGRGLHVPPQEWPGGAKERRTAQAMVLPGATGWSGRTRTTPPSVTAPSTSTSDRKPATWSGGKPVTATT